MCVIVGMPATKRLDKEELLNCYNKNPDGWGAMWVENGKLNHFKGIGHFSKFWAEYKDVPEDVNCALHFRIKTSGKIDQSNSHPFQVLDKTKHGRDLFFMHNGMIDIERPNEDMSDTWHYSKYLGDLLSMHPDVAFDESFLSMVGKETIGSRLLLMDDMGNWHITSKSAWHHEKGCVLSNAHSHKSWGNNNTNYTGRNVAQHTRLNRDHEYEHFDRRMAYGDDYYDGLPGVDNDVGFPNIPAVSTITDDKIVDIETGSTTKTIAESVAEATNNIIKQDEAANKNTKEHVLIECPHSLDDLLKMDYEKILIIVHEYPEFTAKALKELA